MRRNIMLLAFAAVLVMFSGCLGSDEGSSGTDEPVVGQGELTQAGTQTGLSQASPEKAEVTVPITLDYNQVIAITVNISISDGDADTDPDQVGEITLSETDGNGTGSANGGPATPGSTFETSLTVQWDGVNYMSGRWDLYIPVTIAGGDDQWPGPMIWSGIPDHGFAYDLVITYQYHEEESA